MTETQSATPGVAPPPPGVPTIAYRKLDPRAQRPVSLLPDAVGYEVCTLDEVTVHRHYNMAVPTGIAVEVPMGFELQVRNADRTALMVHADAYGPGTYGEIVVRVTNLGDSEVVLEPGTRIAQVVLVPVSPPRRWVELPAMDVPADSAAELVAA